MAELTVNERPDAPEVVIVKAPDWRSTWVEMQLSAPAALKPMFGSEIPREDRYAENNRGLSDLPVPTTAGVVTGSRTNFHAAKWYSIIGLSLRPTVAPTDGRVVSLETLAVSMPNPDAPKGSVTYTRFTGDNPKGIEFRPGDPEFDGFKKGLLRTIRSARPI
jgi:hypothetical protein